MKVYQGFRSRDGCVVLVLELNKQPRELPPRNDVINHSPTGFEWGYCGSGPAQLALAILLDVFVGAEELALNNYQRFKREVIGRLDGDSWVMTDESVILTVSPYAHTEER